MKLDMLAEIIFTMSAIVIGIIILALVISLIACRCSFRKQNRQEDVFKFKTFRISSDIEKIGKGYEKIISFFIIYIAATIVYIAWDSVGIIQQENITAVKEVRKVIESLLGVGTTIIILLIGFTPQDFSFSNSKRILYEKLKIKDTIKILFFTYACNIVNYIILINATSLKEHWIKVDIKLLLTINSLTTLVLTTGIFYLFFVLSGFLLDKGKTEKKMAERLHEQFWSQCNIKLLNAFDECVEEIFLYLTKAYINSTKKNKKRISCMQYIEDIDERDEYNQKTITVFIKILCILSIVNALVDNVQIAVIGMILLIVGSLQRMKLVKLRLATFVYGSSGYVVKIDENYLIPTVGYCPRTVKSIKKQILATKNLMGLFHILSKSISVETDRKMFEKNLLLLMNNLNCHSKDKEGWEKAIFYLPLITSAFYYYVFINEDETLFPVELIKLFETFNLSKNESKRYKRIVNSLIIDMVRYNPTPRDEQTCNNVKDAATYYSKYIVENGYWRLFQQNICDD